jgi:hypothetical protein
MMMMIIIIVIITFWTHCNCYLKVSWGRSVFVSSLFWDRAPEFLLSRCRIPSWTRKSPSLVTLGTFHQENEEGTLHFCYNSPSESLYAPIPFNYCRCNSRFQLILRTEALLTAPNTLNKTSVQNGADGLSVMWEVRSRGRNLGLRFVRVWTSGSTRTHPSEFPFLGPFLCQRPKLGRSLETF